MRTRVAIVLPYFGAGGGEHMVSRLAAHLDLSKVEAEVICIFGEPQNNELEKKKEVVLKTYELSILGVVLSTDVGMRVHINSSLHENHVVIMGRKGSYFLDQSFSQFSSGYIRQFRSYTWKG